MLPFWPRYFQQWTTALNSGKARWMSRTPQQRCSIYAFPPFTDVVFLTRHKRSYGCPWKYSPQNPSAIASTWCQKKSYQVNWPCFWMEGHKCPRWNHDFSIKGDLHTEATVYQAQPGYYCRTVTSDCPGSFRVKFTKQEPWVKPSCFLTLYCGHPSRFRVHCFITYCEQKHEALVFLSTYFLPHPEDAAPWEPQLQQESNSQSISMVYYTFTELLPTHICN